mmetsp:Transcript_3571/g.7319  ORF Transcript_3571/g.7319 Transcript_3571/m.7319 type:complete len:950 (+) Transcript_3571:101-2950(+)
MDLSYADDDGFENYVAKTTSPGPWLFVCTALYSACCMIMIPILVTFKRKRKARSSSLKQSVGDDDESVLQVPSVEENVELELREEYTIDAFGGQKERRANGGGYSLVSWGEGSSIVDTEEQSGCDEYSIGRLDNSKAHFQTILHERVKTCNVAAGNGSLDGPINYSNREIYSETSHPPSCFANVFGFTLEDAFFSIKDIVKPDTETRKILKLALPYTMSEVSAVFFWALTTLLISRYTDVNQLSAYVVTALLIGTSETLIKGFLETLDTVCSHAVGYGNNKLAGQYVQMVATLYTIFSIPLFGMWWFVMGPALRWFGLNAAAVDIGVRYTKLLIFDYLIEGIFEAVGAIPDVTGKERVTNIYQVSHEVIEFAVVWVLFAKVEEFDLFWMGVLHLGSAFIGIVGFTAVTVKLGWFDPYWEGLTKSFALKNKSAVKYVMKMALPLSIGALFEYGEWELLTIFAASMGQAELAAWGLMESIWDLLEAFAEGFANAGEVRVALQLGRGNISQAKRSAWKSLFLVTILGLVITIAYGFLGDYIAVLYTSDETLQEMLKAMVPIVAFGNVFQAFGSMAWALVGGQGRYHHATIVSSTITTTVSIPLAAFFSLAMDFPLESLVAALVIGYSTISMCLSYLLITSDWKFISDKIMDEMDDDSSSSSSSSEDDSSSSSSDKASGNGEVELVTSQENKEGSKPYPSPSSSPSSFNSSLLENDHSAEEDKTAESMILVNIQPQHDTNDQSSVEVSIMHQHSMSSSLQSSSSSSREELAGNSGGHLAATTSGIANTPSMNDENQIKEIVSIPTSPESSKFEGGLSSSYPFSSSSSSVYSTSFSAMNAKVAVQPQRKIEKVKSNNEGAANDGCTSSHIVAESINLPSVAAIIDANDTVTQQNDQLDEYSTPPSTPKIDKLHPSSPFHSSSSFSNSGRNVADTIMEEKDPHELFSTPLFSPKS